MPGSSNESEWLTRKERIDPKLKALGWEVMPFEEGRSVTEYSHHAIEEYPTENGPADYALSGHTMHQSSRCILCPTGSVHSPLVLIQPCAAGTWMKAFATIHFSVAPAMAPMPWHALGTTSPKGCLSAA